MKGTIRYLPNYSEPGWVHWKPVASVRAPSTYPLIHAGKARKRVGINVIDRSDGFIKLLNLGIRQYAQIVAMLLFSKAREAFALGWVAAAAKLMAMWWALQWAIHEYKE